MEADVDDLLKGWAVVTQHSHSKLFEAFETISHDCGFEAGHLNYAVPEEWTAHLKTADNALATLSNEELQEFCIGEQSNQNKIAERSKELYCTHKMLWAFFDDWNKSEENANSK